MDPQRLMGEVQQWTQLAEQLGQKVQMLEQEKQAKVLDIQSREKIAAMDAQIEKLRIMVEAMQKDAQMRMDKDNADRDRQLEAATTHATLASQEATTAFESDRALAQAKIEKVSKENSQKSE
jgi:hypothetical protein